MLSLIKVTGTGVLNTKDTPTFECHNSITSQMVIDKIQDLL
jgi:hypothetical protein